MVSFQTALVTWSHLTSLSIVNLSRLINFLLNFFSGEKKWNFNFGWGEYNGRNSLKKSSWIRYLLGGAALLWLLVDVTDKSKKTLTFLTVPMWFRTIGKKSIAKVAWLSDTSLVQTHNTHVRWRTMRVSVWCTQ